MGRAEVTVDKRGQLLIDPRALVGDARFKYFGVGVASPLAMVRRSVRSGASLPSRDR